MNELIAKRYAKALMELVPAKERSALLKSLQSLQKAFSTPEAAELIVSPLVGNSRKFELLVAPLESKLDPRLFRLLKVMSEKGRLDLVSDLADILDLEIKKASNRFEGSVEADEALPKEEIHRLEEVLERFSDAKIKLKQTKKNGDGLRVSVDDLGLEINYSKSRVKADLLDFIQRAL
ncbi:F0F1 ATP synthase subunit delta [Nitratifractor sp.]